MHSRRIANLHLVENQPQRAPQVLFLHGVLRNWRSYYTLWPQLENELAMALLDFRGHGDSARASSYLVTDYADDAVAILEQLPEPCLVYGHSLGAMVALAAASRIPHRVQGVILEDPPFHTMGDLLPTSTFMPYFQGLEQCLLARQFSDPEDLFQVLSNTIVGVSPQGASIRLRDQRDEPTRRFMADVLMKVDPQVLAPITACQWLNGYDLNELLKTIECPIELLQADKKVGGMLTSDDSSFIRSKLGDQCRLHYFEGTGHSIHWTKIDEVLSIIRQSVGLKK